MHTECTRSTAEARTEMKQKEFEVKILDIGFEFRFTQIILDSRHVLIFL